MIVITGSPGVGKTTLAKELEKLGVGKMLPEEIVSKCVVSYDPYLETKVIDERKLASVLKEFLDKNDGIYIFASHISHFSPKECVLLYILLTCDPNELKRRLEKRKFDSFKIMMNILSEEYGIIKKELEEMGIHYLEFKTDKKSIKEIAEIIMKKIRTFSP